MKSAKQHYNLASEHDSRGEEEEAILYYELAYKHLEDLEPEDQKGLLLGMGSTYRWIEKHDKSIQIFEEAIDRFPDAKEYIVFKALTDLEKGNVKTAFADILELLLLESCSEDILKYRRALKHQINLLKDVK